MKRPIAFVLALPLTALIVLAEPPDDPLTPPEGDGGDSGIMFMDDEDDDGDMSMTGMSDASDLSDTGDLFEKTDPKAIAFFESKIRPVLVEHCYDCHSADARRVRGGFTLDTREGMRRGGSYGPAVVPREPDLSLLIQAIRYDDDLQMPPSDKLPDRVIHDFETWVSMGAPDPRGVDEAVVEAPPVEVDVESGREFWSFQRPKDVAPPAVRDGSWPTDDVDRYILAAMESRGLRPVGDADRATLIRRLSFDLVGLPPTPEQIEAFQRDRSDRAVEHLVDRLLASPAFGERWGRHWLDVARYAESSGKENNIVYPHAWRYRDYVIDAFNDDKPFDRFLREQLAGDLLSADSADQEAEQLIATGFLALGPKSHNTRNRAQFAMDVADEQIDAVSQGMLGMTVACARCHDHKFDPIPARDYYAMAGIFLSTETCFGTPQTQGNRRAAPLLELPEDATVASGPPMPLRLHDNLLERREQAEDQQERLLEQVRTEGRRGEAAARLRRTRSQLSTLDDLLARYDENGRPNQRSRVAMGARDVELPRDARLLVRGELDQASDIVSRGFVQVLSDDATPSIGFAESGRLELADWIASDANPLTARVWVNRVWLHLFGEPLVPTPDNFGHSGQPPTHPRLLDHLAVTFMDDGWSTRRLVRRLVLSHTYRLGSYHNPTNYKIDPDNTYRWRMSRRRLEAEAIRDAMLQAAGTLRLERPAGSPTSYAEGGARGLNRLRQAMPEQPVRSVYLPVIRDDVPESLEVFDFAEPSFVTGDREETNIPSQALYLLNSASVIRQSEAMAERLMRMPGRDVERVEHAFVLVFGRGPTPAEKSAVMRFFADFPDAQASGAPEPNDRRQRPQRRRGDRRGQRRFGADEARDRGSDMRHTGWAAFCQSLFASAEFRYLN